MGNDIYQLRERAIIKGEKEKMLGQANSIEKLQRNAFYGSLDKFAHYIAKVEIQGGKWVVLEEFKL